MMLINCKIFTKNQIFMRIAHERSNEIYSLSLSFTILGMQTLKQKRYYFNKYQVQGWFSFFSGFLLPSFSFQTRR